MDQLTTGDISKMCGVAPRTTSKWIDGGLLKGTRLPTVDGKPGDRRVDKKDFLEFVEQRMPDIFISIRKELGMEPPVMAPLTPLPFAISFDGHELRILARGEDQLEVLAHFRDTLQDAINDCNWGKVAILLGSTVKGRNTVAA